MNGTIILKLVLFLLVVAYVVSPVDLLPGPIDDALVILFGLASQKKLTVSHN